MTGSASSSALVDLRIEASRTAFDGRVPGKAVALIASLLILIATATQAWALKPITLTGNQDVLDVIALGEIHSERGDVLQVETAASADGATARMAVQSTLKGSNPNWIVFALHNPTNKAIELWLTANRYTPIGSSIVWPDLDTRRIVAVSHSSGFAPERISNDRTDIWRLTIERGQTITYTVELASQRFPRTLLWKPIEFEQRQREMQLFNGILLGITGLLAVFLTAVFAANHKAIFPTAALLAWCALGLLCVDFGFWHKLFQMKPEDNAQYRAAAEAAVAASLVIFLAAFLRVNLWSGFARTLFVVWIVAQLAIIGIAVLDPKLAATVARLSFGVIGALGLVLILLLAARGLDRALALLPTWILFLVWLFSAAVTLTGRLDGDFAISGLVSGLVLVVLLIGFTVTQYAFRSTDLVVGSGAGGQQLRLAALDRAGAAFWEWNVRRDELVVDPEIENALGLGTGELPTQVEQLIAYVHPADRERFRLELAQIREKGSGTLRTGIRLRHADSSYRWLDFEGASVPSSDRRNLRCVGLVRDTTDTKRAQERLLNNAVYDSLTSLPNSELFLDRLDTALTYALRDGVPHQVAVLFVDLDKFRSVNTSFGLVVGDSIILTISRRLARIVGTRGTLARIGGDQFGIFLVGQSDPQSLAAVAERIRLSLRSTIRIAGQEIALTGSIGIALSDPTCEGGRALLRDAEVAMHRAKRLNSERAEIFTPQMLTERQERLGLERDLTKALEQRQLRLLYQPVVALANDELVGFEAVLKWQHPRLGTLSPAEFLPLAEGSELIAKLGSFMIGHAVRDLQRWQQELSRPERPLFLTVNISSRQLISNDLVHEIRHVRTRAVLPSGTLKLAITESLVMDNPEQASHLLELLKEAGVDLWMDRFGTGYSSLTYLSRFPFEAFRLDKALVELSDEGERSQALIKSMVALAHELGKSVVGDGVGTPQDAAFLRSLGCQYAQGFHYGEAMTEDDVLRLLKLIRKSERRMRRRGLVRGQDKKRSSEGTAPAPDARTGPTAPATTPSMPPPHGGAAPGSPHAAPPPPAPGQGRARAPQDRTPGMPTGPGKGPPFHQPPGQAGPPPQRPTAPDPRNAPPSDGRGNGQRAPSSRPSGPIQQDGSPAANTAPPLPGHRPQPPGQPGIAPPRSDQAQQTPPSGRQPVAPPPSAEPGRPAPHGTQQTPASGQSPGAPLRTPDGTPWPTPPGPQPIPPGAGATTGSRPQDGPRGPGGSGPAQGGQAPPAPGGHGQQPSRRPDLAALSPTVVASLARLAGDRGTGKDARKGPRDGSTDQPNTSRKKPDAAE